MIKVMVIETQVLRAVHKLEDGVWGRREPVSRHNAGFAEAV